jgi:hypothetical protein
MSSSLFALKAASEAGSAEQKALREKRRNVLVLIHQHLIENGYIESAERYTLCMPIHADTGPYKRMHALYLSPCLAKSLGNP